MMKIIYKVFFLPSFVNNLYVFFGTALFMIHVVP